LQDGRLDDFRCCSIAFALRLSADCPDKNAGRRAGAQNWKNIRLESDRKLLIFAQTVSHPASADLLVDDIKPVCDENGGAFSVGAAALAFCAGIERDGADNGERGANPLEHLWLSAFRVAFDEIDAGNALRAHKAINRNCPLFDARPFREYRRIGAFWRQGKIKLGVFVPDDIVKGRSAGERSDISLEAGKNQRVRLKTENPRAEAAADVGEFAGVRSDIENDTVARQRYMPANAVFALKLVKPGVPALAVELPAQRRGDGDPHSIDGYKNPLGSLVETNINIAVNIQRRKRSLAKEFEVLDVRELQVFSRRRRKSAILAGRTQVTPREGDKV